MPYLSLKPSHAAVKTFYKEIEQTKQASFVHEGTVAPHFAALLRYCGNKVNWQLIEQYPIARKNNDEVSMEDNILTKKIIGCAYTVHNTLGTGFLEKVYENALKIELEKAGLAVRQQMPINVHYNGQVVGEYFADLLVDNRVIVELKAVQNIDTIHEVQLVNYLTATGLETGLLLNFGQSVQVRRKFLNYKTN